MMPHAEYIRSLPKRHAASAALLFNDKNELLIVKQNYKEGWSVPGGVLDALESPHDGCVREIKEEIGLDIPTLTFLVVTYKRNSVGEEFPYDSIEFMFSGGTLTAEQISHIVLQKDELDEYKFCTPDEALALLRPTIAARVRAALDAIVHSTPVYTEQKK